MNTPALDPSLELGNSPVPTYTRTAVALHWLMAVLLVAAFIIGSQLEDMPLSPQKFQFISWHKWAGVTAFALVLIRLLWRFTHRPPELPASIPLWQQRVSAATHVLIYVLMLAIPLTGWLMSSAKGFQTVWFGVLPLPDVLEKNKELGHLLEGVHAVLNNVLLVLVLAHVGAALKHHVLDKDTVLTRMLPFLKPRH
jgi:cytochrome b561